MTDFLILPNKMVAVYNGFLIIENDRHCSYGILHDHPPYHEAYFGSFESVSSAKLGIDLALDLMLHYCKVKLD